MSNINPKEARLELGLNQTAMAKAMGVARGTWLKWERGEQGITAAPARLIDIALKLHRKKQFEENFGEYLK